MPAPFLPIIPAAESQLVQRLLARDETAMSDFYDHYGVTLFRVIYPFVKQREAAEDVLQESLVKIWNAFPSYNPLRGRLYTWVVNICRHQAVDYLRYNHARGAGHTGALSDSPAAHQVAADTFHPEHLDVHTSLAYLRPAYRRVLELRYFDGLKLEEVAELLELPLGTVKTRQRQALRQLAGLWR